MTSVITAVLRPYAVQAIIERHNILSLDEKEKSPQEKFANIEDNIQLANFHTFGYPVFILDTANQPGGLGTPKWEPQSHTSLYEGHSPYGSSTQPSFWSGESTIPCSI